MSVEPNGSSMTLKNLFRLLLIAVLLSSLSGTALAQSTAVLKGSVTDAAGAAVPHAKVVVKNQATGVEWSTESDNAGSYQASSLPIGKYLITITATGFETSIIQNITLETASTVTQNVEMKVGQVSEQVTVTVETPVIDSSTITMGQVIDQKTTQEIPLNGRHFVDLSLLTPGTVTPPQNGFLTAPLRGQGSFAFNSAGQREDTINFLVNGVNLSDMVQNQITFQPSINTVAEFKLDNSTYSAEYGRNSGSIVNIATRSGTNEFHGEVFDFLRNSAMDARNFFNPTTVLQSPFKRNNFGAAVGGPILKNRAHFFASYEALRQRQGLTINSLVLSPAQATQAQSTGDAAVKALAALIPGQTTTENGLPFFQGSATAPVNIDQGTADVDVELTVNDRLHGYVAIQQDKRQEPTLQGNTLQGWGDTRASRRQIGTVSEDHIFGPSLTNTVRIGYNRIHITFTPNQQLNSATFNVNSGVNAPIGLAQIDIGGGALDFGGPAGFPQGRGDTSAVLNDTLSWLKGRHSFVFGGEVRRVYNDNFSLDPAIFRFSSVANFLSDTVSSFSFAGTTADRILSPAYDAFAQDSFKWMPNLTLQVGLRYSWYATPSEAANRFTVFDAATDSLVQVGTNAIGQPFHTNNLNFQPRLGIIWDPFKKQKTIVRAGYAILTDEPVTGIITGLNSNPPFSQPLTSAAAGLKLTNAATVAGPSGLAPNAIDPNFDNPYVQSYNLNIEEQLTPSTGLTIGYMGSKGTHLRIARNINQLELVGGALVRPFPTLSATSSIKPGANLGNISEVTSGANSDYNALVVELNRRLSHGLQLISSYTYSKSIDDNSLNSQGVILQDSLDVANSRGLSDFDARHRFVVSGFYELPFHGNRLVSGWELGTIVQAQTGNPLNVTTGISNFTGTTALTAGGGLRPDLLMPVGITGNPAQWFTNNQVCTPFAQAGITQPLCSATPNAAFALPLGATPAGDHFGNLGRNVFTGPGFVNTDLSLVKNTKLTERMNLQFRTEAFDVFNHPNFGNPNLNPQSSSFGRITSTRFPTGDFGSARQLQLSLKLQF
jgi:Carboxypeptidase regulatory-like domain/TonB dependent receptor-like, beta-barrel